MKRACNISLINLVELMIIVNFAFYNYTYLVISVQILVLGMSLYILLRNKLFGLTLSYVKWWVPFITFCALSGIWGGFKETYVPMMISIVQCMVIGTSITLCKNTDNGVSRILRAMIIGGIVLSIRLLVSTPMYAWGTERIGHFIGYGANSAGIMLAACAVVAVFEFLENRKKLYIALTVVFLVMVIFSGSKKSLVCAVIGISIIILLASENKSKKFLSLMLIVLLVSLGCYLVMTIPELYTAIGVRFEALIDTLTGRVDLQARTSSTDRVRMIQYGFEVFKSHPIIGIGIDGFRYVNPILNAYAHNNYVELLADYGFIGFVLYYSYLFYRAISSTLRLKKDVNINRLYICFEISILLFMFFLDFGCVSYVEEYSQIIIAVALTVGASSGQLSVNEEAVYN